MAKIQRLGFTKLGGRVETQHSNEIQQVVNIIFVHGLQGHPRATWESTRRDDRDEADGFTKKRAWHPFKSKSLQSESSELNVKSGVYWPEQLLALDVPNAKIWTYGYNADIIGGLFQANNKNSVSQHGQDLAIKLEREIENEDPIIFVVHSLGGIIVKDALHRSETSCERTILVMFLGTPHRGSGVSQWGQIISNLARISLQDSNKKILETLEVNGEVLDNINNSFKSLLYNGNIKVHSFQEARGMTGIRGLHTKVVDDFSSKLDLPSSIETVESIDANHIQMVKFSSSDDAGYRAVCAVIKKHVKDAFETRNVSSTAAGIFSLTDPEKKCIQSFYSNYEMMRQNIPTRHPTTCDWLFDHPDFISWTETNTSKPLWISGNPGMGKTVLSKYLVAKFEAKKNWSNRVLYYFFSDQDENRRSAISLLRSLIHQCLSHRPALVRPHVIPSFDTQGENLLNSFPTLWSIFINLACDAQVGGMICILDALDECKEDSRDELLQQIGNYFSTDTLSKCNYQYKPGMKLIITSRPYERIRIRLFPYTIIRLQAEKEGKVISRDIEAYVDYEVEQLGRLRGYSKDLKQVVHNALLTGADGMFLWVSLMVKLLQRTPAKHVAQSVKKMPEGIDSIYRRILNEVPQGSEKTVSSILKWIAYAFRPLTLTELGIACAIQPAYNSLSTVPIEEREGILDDIKFCGPLVKVQDDTVHLVHQTTKEFLIQSWASNNHISNYLIAGNEAHSELATACLTYLSFDELEQSPKIFDYRGDKSYNSFIADYPLLQYAAVYWYQHIKRSGETSRNLQKAVQNSLLGEKKRQLSFNIHQHELTKDLIGKQSSLHILIRAGLTLFAENAILLGSAENDHKDERKSTALHLASERGQETIVKLLLAKGSQVNAEQEIECLAESTVSTPLHLAAENGHDRVVELLLQNGASVNAEETMIHYWDRSTSTKRYRGASSTKRYRTTLHIASEKGYTTIVRKLLEFGANVNSEQYEYESHTCFGDQHFYLCAFDLAAQNGHYEVCRLLQEHGGVASTYDNNVGWEEVIDI